MNKNKIQRPPWKIRRRIIYTTLLTCAVWVSYIMLFGDDREVNETIVSSAFILCGSVIGAYIFGAAWDDANVMKHIGKEAYQEPLDEYTYTPREVDNVEPT